LADVAGLGGGGHRGRVRDHPDTFTIGDDLEVRRLGFGAMQLTGKGVWGEPPDVESARQVLRRAVELGVNLIDTADSYGPEVSERLIGEALAPYPDGVVIATKAGLTRPGPGRWVPDGRPQHLREACEGSLRRLRLERIDVYQLHRPDPKVPFAESVGTMAELRAEGKVRHVGLSNVSVGQLEEARRIVPIVTVQNLYNLDDRSSEDVLDACTAAGIGFIPWYPLATGRLTKIRRFRRSPGTNGATPAQVALAWLLAHSPVMLPIPGTKSIPHLEENVAAADLELTRADVDALTR
jgi:pyridoxine 4-dehydrogenase